MNFDTLNELMTQLEMDEDFVKIIEKSLRKLERSGMDIYMVAVHFAILSSCIVQSSLSDEDFAQFGRYLGKKSKHIEDYIATKTQGAIGWDHVYPENDRRRDN